ncbi:MAG: autotransporter-associated beta strand repeat-containing protein [Planctomycetota bacterium]
MKCIVRSNPLKKALLLAGLAAALSAVGAPALAQSVTWTSTSGGNWFDAGNWAGGIPNGATAQAILPAPTGQARTVTVDSAVTVQSIQMGYGSQQNILSLNADLDVGQFTYSPAGNYMNYRVNMNGRTLTLGTGNLTSVQVPNLSGTGTFVKTGTGNATLIYDSWSTFTGTYRVDNGILYGTYGRISPSSTVQVNSGGTYYINTSGGELPNITLNGAGYSGQGALRTGNFNYSKALTLASDASVSVDAGNTLSLTGWLSGTGNLTKLGSGRLLIAGDSSGYTANTTITSGTLEVSGVFQNSVITVNGGGVLKAPAYRVGTVTLNGGTWDNTALPEWIRGTSFSGNDDGNWSDAANWGTGITTQAILGTVTGNGNDGTNRRTITISAPGSISTLNMLQENGSFINKLKVDADFAVGTLTLAPSSNSWERFELEIAAGKALQVTTAANGFPQLLGSGTIEKVGSGNAMLIYSVGTSFNGTYKASGGVTHLNYNRISGLNYVVDGGTLQIDNTTYFYNGTGITLSGSGASGAGALRFTAAPTPGFWSPSSITLAGPATLAVDNNVTVSLNTGIGGNGQLVKAGNGTLALTGSNTFTGAASVEAGTLAFNRVTALNSSSGIGINAGTILDYTGTAATLSRNVTVATSGTGTIRNSGGQKLTLSGTLTKDGRVLRLTGGTFDVTGQIVGASANSDLLVDGTSTVTLLSANNYNGPTFVNQASNLIVGINNAIPSNSVVTLGVATTRGTLDLGTFNNAIGGLVFSGSGGTVKMAANQTSAAQLSSASALTLGSNSSLDLTGMQTSAGLYRLISASSLSGTFTSGNVTGLNSNYVLRYGTVNANEISAQRKADQSATSFTMTTGTVTRALVNTNVAVSGSLTNSTASGGTNLTVSLSSGLGGLTVGSLASGTTSIAPQTSTSINGAIQTGTTAGLQNWSVINTDNNAITTVSTATGSITVVNDRTFTTPSISFGRFLGTALQTGTSLITSTGLNGVTADSTIGVFANNTANGLTLSLNSGTNAFTGLVTTQTATYTTGGSWSGGLGGFSSSLTGTATNEFGGTSVLTVNYTGTSVAQRTYTVNTTPINLGRFLKTGAASGSTSITSTGLNASTENGSIGGFSVVGGTNGLSLTLSNGSANFAGATPSQTADYTVGGIFSGAAGAISGTFAATTTAEFTSGTTLNVAYTGNAVNQRTFSVSNSGTINLGNFLRGTAVTGTASVTSLGDFATTASGTLGSFTGGPSGFSLATNDSPAFLGASGTQSALYTLSGSAASAGAINGSFTSSVSAELGSIDPVTVAVTGTAYNPAIASFNALSTLTSGTLSIGEFNQNTGVHTAGFDIYNLFTGDQTYAADLKFVSYSLIGPDAGGLSLNLTTGSFGNLAPGLSSNWLASLDSSNVGGFTNQYQLNFVSSKNGQSLGGPQSMMLTVTGVIIVPEPGAFALAGIGIAAAAYACRRRRA